MTIELRSGRTYGPETPPSQTEPLDQPASPHGPTSRSQLAGPLAGLLRTPSEITRQIASHLNPHSRIALADSRLSLNAQLRDDRLTDVIISQQVPSVKTGADAEAVLKLIGKLPVSRQGKLLEALGAHVYLQLPYGPERAEAERLFLDAARSHTGKPSALIDAFKKAADDPGETARLFRDALDTVENNGWSAQEAIKRYEIEGNMNHALLLAAESYVSSDETPALGNGATRFQAFQ